MSLIIIASWFPRTKKLFLTTGGIVIMSALNLLNRVRNNNQGEILKAERMLVRIERIDNSNQLFPSEYTEQSRISTRLKREWREYYVVARAPHDTYAHVILHVHKSRVCFAHERCLCSEFRRQ
jgi:hypothetical protein